MRFALDHGRLTLVLRAWLASRNDPGTPPLIVRRVTRDVIDVSHRRDGADLSDSEAAHVRGVLAAHAEQPLTELPS